MVEGSTGTATEGSCRQSGLARLQSSSSCTALRHARMSSPDSVKHSQFVMAFTVWSSASRASNKHGGKANGKPSRGQVGSIRG